MFFLKYTGWFFPPFPSGAGGCAWPQFYSTEQHLFWVFVRSFLRVVAIVEVIQFFFVFRFGKVNSALLLFDYFGNGDNFYRKRNIFSKAHSSSRMAGDVLEVAPEALCRQREKPFFLARDITLSLAPVYPTFPSSVQKYKTNNTRVHFIRIEQPPLLVSAVSLWILPWSKQVVERKLLQLRKRFVTVCHGRSTFIWGYQDLYVAAC